MQASRCQEFHMQTYRCLSLGFPAAGSILSRETNPQILSAYDSAISPSPRDKVVAQSIGQTRITMEPSSIQYAAYVGLDWADREHAWCLQTPDHMSRDSGFVAQTPEAIEAWAAALAQRFQGRPVAVALEQSRGALLFALTKYVHLILY